MPNFKCVLSITPEQLFYIFELVRSLAYLSKQTTLHVNNSHSYTKTSKKTIVLIDASKEGFFYITFKNILKFKTRQKFIKTNSTFKILQQS